MDTTLRQYILDNYENAIRQQHIQPFYQPVIRSISSKLCSFEALARWVDPKYGVISPGQFIPVMEENNLIHLVDSAIIRQVCARIRRTMDSGRIPIPVSVNLSRLDFLLCDIFSVVDEAVRYYRIPHDFLYIEITESIVAEREDLMRTVVSKFREAGFQVWMDDFGSGFSSLNILKDYDFDELKIDMQFLSSFHRRSRAILTSIIRMAKEINIHTLAEGVETEEQFFFLRNSGCEKIQGYFFGKPMPYDEELAHLEKKGIKIEKPQERKYYDDIGKIDFLSAVPFMKEEERESLTSARQMNSIPLSMIEIRKDSFRLLFSNLAFEEMATDVGISSDLFQQELACRKWPLSMLPARIIRLMDSTRNGEDGRMVFVSNEQYYELRAKCIAKTRGSFSVLLKMNNLSQVSEAANLSHLDEGLRHIYTLFERITMIDLKNDAITPLYVTTRDNLMSGHSGLGSLREEFVEKWIYPDDREAFLEFMDIRKMEDRVDPSRGTTPFISRLFRTFDGHGRYIWKEYTLLRYREGCCIELVRNAHKEVLVLEEKSELTHEAMMKGLSAEMLWHNLLKTDIIRMFWKDPDRRFVGVNKGFLDYYGFESEKAVIGKTDEDLGWHIRPDQYVNTELQIIEEGVSTRNVPGFCMRDGENREILASKMPLYNKNGEISGLFGYFIDRELLSLNDMRGSDTLRRDSLTGLLNTRGIAEEAKKFEEQFYLRNMDFVRIHISINDFAILNREYGFDFGDKAITELGKKLKCSFGTTAAIGRYNGHHFVILCQFKKEEELVKICNKIKKNVSDIREIDSIPTTIYLSFGYTRYSETGDLDEQKKKSEVRLMADYNDNTSSETLMEASSEIFHLYDDLPISYAVYKVLRDRNGKAHNAVLFYVNHKFEERSGKTAVEMLGHRTRDLFPSLTEDWYKKAERAAWKGETVVDSIFFQPTGKHYYMTASPVIRTGFCCFTYQEIEQLK